VTTPTDSIPAEDRPEAATAAARTRPRSSGVSAPAASRLWLGLDLALLALAYRSLVVVRISGPLPQELEGWFFAPTTSSTPPVVSLLLAGWVLWRRRAEIAALPRAASLLARAAGLAACAIGIAIALWATTTGALDLLVASLVFEAAGFCLWLRGAAGLRRCGLVFALLLLAFPMPAPLMNEIAFWLQLAAARFSGWALYAMGLPAVVSADQILRAEASFAVIETCSGLRSIETLLTLSLLMAELFGRRGAHTLLLALAAPLVGFVANGLRVVTLILNPHSQIHSVHNAQGIAVLLGGLLALYLVDSLLERFLRARPPGTPVRRAAGRPGMRALPSAVLAATALVGFLTPQWMPPTRLPLALNQEIPAQLARWRSTDLKQDEAYLGSLAFKDSVLRRYFNASEQVDLFAAQGNHDRDRRGPFSSKLAVPGSGWVTEDRFELSLGPERERVEGRICRRRTERRLVYYWMEGAEPLAAEIWRSGAALDQSRWRRRRDALVLRLSTPLQGSSPDALRASTERMEAFFELLRPSLDRIDRRYPRKSFSSFLPSGKSLSLGGLSR